MTKLLPENDEIQIALLKSGKQQFLAHGFDRASLRVICRNANVTTGAFYSHFDKKEDLFCAIVEPTVSAFRELFDTAAGRETVDLGSAEMELRSITFARAHRDEYRLLLDCADGTKFAGFRKWLTEDCFYPKYQALFDRSAGKPVDPSLVRIILHMKLDEYTDLIYGDYTEEEVHRLVDRISVFSRTGFQALMRLLREENSPHSPILSSK